MSFRILLLTTIVAWFGVVVPLHPRGIIKLPGAHCDADTRSPSCCHPGKPSGEDSKHKPIDPDCAVCHFVATMDLPPEAGFDVPPLGLIEQLKPAAPQVAPVIAYVLPASERGPPIA